MTLTSTDRIRKQILLTAPQQRVWDAIADARRFGQWFGVDIDGAFTPGARVRGRILDPRYAHIPFDVTIDDVEPQHRLAWRWHPQDADELDVDHAHEPATRVVFELEAQSDGTLLTVVESGFDALPAGLRDRLYRGNEDGWTQQLLAITKYVADAAG
jgi:uncharacterized protein YndB with AHSA1/START domain